MPSHTARRRAQGVVLALAAGFGLAGWQPIEHEPPVAPGVVQAPPPVTVPAGAPALVLLATEPSHDGISPTHTDLYVLPPGTATLPAPRLAVRHLPGSVRAAVLAGGAVAANAPRAGGRDVSFNGELLHLDPRTGAQRVLVDRVSHASWPHPTAEGEVLVTRGQPGQGTPPGELRVDSLTVDAVDPRDGSTRTLLRHDGLLAHIAGQLDGEVLVYRLGPAGETSTGADIVGVDRATGAVRVLAAEIPPFARDFSVDAERRVLVYRQRDASDPGVWNVTELDLDGGARRTVFEGPTFALAPHAWPGGAVALNPLQRGLTLRGGSLDPGTPDAPLGAGVDVVRAFSADARFVALLHTVESDFATPFVVDRASGAVARVPQPPRQRADIAGFLEEGAP